MRFCQACEKNKSPIKDQLVNWFAKATNVLEIGSGTAQHAVYMAQYLSHLQWQCSDVIDHVTAINEACQNAHLTNLPNCLELDVSQAELFTIKYRSKFDAIFTSNTFHIMSWQNVIRSIQIIDKVCLRSDVSVVIYGPFKHCGQYTSTSNQDFDHFLQQDHPQQGLRELNDIQSEFQKINFELYENVAMPANNQCLIFKR